MAQRMCWVEAFKILMLAVLVLLYGGRTIAYAADAPAGPAPKDDGFAYTGHDSARLEAEAKTLFAQIIRDHERPFTGCELEGKWGTYSVDYAIAHKALGLAIHADLTSPTTVADPLAIIGKVGKLEGVICDANAYKRRVETLVEAWQRGLKTLPMAERKAGGFDVPHMSYTFPIFDGSFSRAVIVRQGEAGSVRFDAEGQKVRTTLEGGASALVYRRVARRWRKLDDI